MTCIVYNCSNIDCDTSDIIYFGFPKESPLREKWISASGWCINQINLKTAKICSQHFEESCYSTEITTINNIATPIRALKDGAIPTRNLPTRLIIKDSIDLEDTVFIDVQLAEESTNENINTASNTLDTYASVKTVADLAKLRKINESLQKKIEQAGKRVSILKAELPVRIKQHNETYIELAKLNQEYSRVKRSMLSISEQKNLLAKVFSPAQIKMLSGKRKINWTDDDMAVAYTIRHLSNRTCYTFLKDNFGIPLPGVSSIDRWLTRRRDDGGTENTAIVMEEQTESSE